MKILLLAAFLMLLPSVIQAEPCPPLGCGISLDSTGGLRSDEANPDWKIDNNQFYGRAYNIWRAEDTSGNFERMGRITASADAVYTENDKSVGWRFRCLKNDIERECFRIQALGDIEMFSDSGDYMFHNAAGTGSIGWTNISSENILISSPDLQADGYQVSTDFRRFENVGAITLSQVPTGPRKQDYFCTDVTGCDVETPTEGSVAGDSWCVYDRSTSRGASSGIRLAHGTGVVDETFTLADGVSLSVDVDIRTDPTADAKGDFACFVNSDGVEWLMTTSRGTWQATP